MHIYLVRNDFMDVMNLQEKKNERNPSPKAKEILGDWKNLRDVKEDNWNSL